MRISVRMSKSTAPVGVEGDLPNYTPMSRSVAYGWGLICFGLVFASIGVLIGMRVMGLLGGKVHAPMWVLSCAGVVFLTVGSTMCFQGMADLIHRMRGRRDAILHAGADWRADYIWAGSDSKPGMRSREHGSWIGFAMGMLVVTCFTMVSTWISMTTKDPGVTIFLWMMSGFMYLIFLVFAWVFIQRVLTAIRFGSPRLVYESIPVRPGEMVVGTVLCPRGFRALKRIRITLRFVVERYEQTPRTSGESKIKLLCSGTASDEWVIDDVAHQIGGIGISGEIPIAFLIPDDAEDTQALSRPARFWDLEIRGEAKGVDFVHRFAVPVYSDA